MQSTDPVAPAGGRPSSNDLHLPQPPSERRAWLLAGGLALLGAAVLAAVLTGLVGGTSEVVQPPPVPAVVATPTAWSSSSAPATAPTARARVRSRARGGSVDAAQVPIARRWMEGFYPIYATAQRTFGVNWLLLASIHRQESAFSTAPGTYHGLNFAHCCGGPMQFNVRNGRVTTWDLVSNSYIYGSRPAAYDHMTAAHPSIYDDFDSIMAAAHLLSANGARYPLDDSAWLAAYDYYGHDYNGVIYADEVIARAIAWSQHGFCIDCGVPARMVEAVDAAYGAPVRAALAAAAAAVHPRRARAASRHRSR
jgi:hypothetical protein